MYNVWSAIHDNINKCNNNTYLFCFRIRVLRYDPGDNFYPHLDGHVTDTKIPTSTP
jgi:hypothetical protein